MAENTATTTTATATVGIESNATSATATNELPVEEREEETIPGGDPHNENLASALNLSPFLTLQEGIPIRMIESLHSSILMKLLKVLVTSC